jgi:uridine kinase
MKLRTDNRILLISDKYGSRVPFQIGKIINAISKAAAKVGGFGHDVREGINSALFGGRSDEDMAEFLARDVQGRLNSNPNYLTPNTPAPIDEIHRCVIETLRFWGLRSVADEYQFYSSGRLWVRRGALEPRLFSHLPYPQELVDEASRFNAAHDCDTVDGINRWVRSGRLKELVAASIERYDEHLKVATRLLMARPAVRLLVISGPSSSGKTTTTNKVTEMVHKNTGDRKSVV